MSVCCNECTAETDADGILRHDAECKRAALHGCAEYIARADTRVVDLQDRMREIVIHDGFASLVEMVAMVRRIGGYMAPEHQETLRRAERVIERAKVTP